MEEYEVTWGRASLIWWSLAWRAFLFSSIAGFAVGFAVNFVFALLPNAMGMGDMAETYSFILGVVVGVFIGIWTVKTVLDKEFAEFRIALVPSIENKFSRATSSDVA